VNYYRHLFISGSKAHKITQTHKEEQIATKNNNNYNKKYNITKQIKNTALSH